jgi:hypothetical protein
MAYYSSLVYLVATNVIAPLTLAAGEVQAHPSVAFLRIRTRKGGLLMRHKLTDKRFALLEPYLPKPVPAVVAMELTSGPAADGY